MQEHDRSQHSFYLEVKLRIFFIKQTGKFVTKTFILLVAVQVKILSYAPLFLLFQNHPFVNPVQKLTPEPWRLLGTESKQAVL